MLLINRNRQTGIRLRNRKTGEVLEILVVRQTEHGCRLGVTANPQDWEVTRFQQLQSGQVVRVTQQLEWIYGIDCTIPVGEMLCLKSLTTTSAGPRWTADWGGKHISNIPPDMIEATSGMEVTGH